jgi:hypothetical protein
MQCRGYLPLTESGKKLKYRLSRVYNLVNRSGATVDKIRRNEKNPESYWSNL